VARRGERVHFHHPKYDGQSLTVNPIVFLFQRFFQLLFCTKLNYCCPNFLQKLNYCAKDPLHDCFDEFRNSHSPQTGLCFRAGLWRPRKEHIATDFFRADDSCRGIAIHFLTMTNSKAKVSHGSNFHFLTQINRSCSYIFPLGLPSSAVGSKSNEPFGLNYCRHYWVTATILRHSKRRRSGQGKAPFGPASLLGHTVTIRKGALWPPVQHVSPSPPSGCSRLRAPGPVIYAALQDPSPSRRVRWRRAVTP